MTTQLREVPAATPFVVAPGEGERIWLGAATMTLKATAASTAGELMLIETDAPVGHGPPLHVHHDEHEAFYVIEGRLEIVVGGVRHEAGAGAFAFLPRGIAHTFRVIGDTPARMLTIAVPGGLEGFFREAGRPAEHDGPPPPAQLDVARLRAASAHYNNEIVGPPLAAADGAR
jgi:mannose-6-phosphate isomerase-like protein (cupin superfamily)